MVEALPVRERTTFDDERESAAILQDRWGKRCGDSFSINPHADDLSYAQDLKRAQREGTTAVVEGILRERGALV